MKFFWKKLTNPSKLISDETEQREARLLSSIMVSYLVLVSAMNFSALIFAYERFSLSSRVIAIVVFSLHLMSYFLSRTKYYRFAAGTMIATTTVSIFISVALSGEPSVLHGSYSWLLVPVLISTLVFPINAAIILTLLICAMMAVFAVMFPATHADLAITFLPAFAIMSILISVITVQRKNAQKELKLAKELAEGASRAKTFFLANISHEIRSPLGVILGFSEMLAAEKLAEQDRNEYVRTIHRNGTHLMGLINELLDLSKIEADRLDVAPCAINLRNEVLGLIAEHNKVASLKGVNVVVNFNDDVPKEITTDPMRIRQALNNLLGNAVKFTDNGEVKLAIRPKGDIVQFVVTDTGIGIAEQNLNKLFEPFSQVDPKSMRKYGGTGLGLALSRRLARLLGGDLKLEWSREGEGTQFCLSIPTDAKRPDKGLQTSV